MTQEQLKESPREAAAGGVCLPSAASDNAPSPTLAATAAPGREAGALWRALAGMVLSLAVACVIVAMEFSSQAAHRVNRMRRRLAALSLKVRKLEADISAERARLAAARRELGASGTLRAVLLRSDLATIRLAPASGAGAPHGPGASQWARVGNAAGADSLGALLMFSLKEHRAVLQVAGLRPSTDQVFVLWWSATHGAPLRAAEFRTAPNGSALVVVPLPNGFMPVAATVTAERDGARAAAPQHTALLRGALRH
jgi:hypothetical protein